MVLEETLFTLKVNNYNDAMQFLDKLRHRVPENCKGFSYCPINSLSSSSITIDNTYVNYINSKLMNAEITARYKEIRRARGPGKNFSLIKRSRKLTEEKAEKEFKARFKGAAEPGKEGCQI